MLIWSLYDWVCIGQVIGANILSHLSNSLRSPDKSNISVHFVYWVFIFTIQITFRIVILLFTKTIRNSLWKRLYRWWDNWECDPSQLKFWVSFQKLIWKLGHWMVFPLQTRCWIILWTSYNYHMVTTDFFEKLNDFT